MRKIRPRLHGFGSILKNYADSRIRYTASINMKVRNIGRNRIGRPDEKGLLDACVLLGFEAGGMHTAIS
jgi:hypothetical protein